MKKIFTLVFSLSLFASAFAQFPNGRQNQIHRNTHQSSTYPGNNHNSRNGSNTYSKDKNSQWNNKDNRDQHDQYAYSKIDRGRSYGDRNEHYFPKYNIDRRGHDYDQKRQPVRAPLIQIILGIGRR